MFKLTVFDSHQNSLHTKFFTNREGAIEYRAKCLDPSLSPQFPRSKKITKPGVYRKIPGIERVTEMIPGTAAILDHEGREVRAAVLPEEFELAPAIPEIEIVVEAEEYELEPAFEIEISECE